MSLSRLALRLAAYEALCPYASVQIGPWPTLAGANVYDSRLDPIAAADNATDWAQFVATLDAKPMVTVYTETQETTPAAGEYSADVEMVDLFIEMMIANVGSIEAAAAAGGVVEIGPVVTDRQQEATLDFLEAQVRAILDPQSRAFPSATIYRTVVRELHHVHSVPMRDAAKAARLGARTLTLRLRVNAPQWPQTPASPAPTGLAALPQPLLGVALALDPNSSGGQLCATLAALAGAPPALIPLNDIRLNTNLNRSAAPTNPAGSDSDVVGDVPLIGI